MSAGSAGTHCNRLEKWLSVAASNVSPFRTRATRALSKVLGSNFSQRFSATPSSESAASEHPAPADLGLRRPPSVQPRPREISCGSSSDCGINGFGSPIRPGRRRSELRVGWEAANNRWAKPTDTAPVLDPTDSHDSHSLLFSFTSFQNSRIPSMSSSVAGPSARHLPSRQTRVRSSRGRTM